MAPRRGGGDDGRDGRARRDLGLYAEEMEPGSNHMRGNYPQALTYLALIAAAAIHHATSAGSQDPR
ncbi:MAG: hypothetical protein ACRDLV_13755 [Solirubrobacteraceae bacterium]